MKRTQATNQRQSRQRGDTIVEVLIALAVLGAVLGGAYVVVNRNVRSNQSSQERIQAVKVAESQFERLKIVAANDPSALSWTNFCMTPTNTRANTGQPDCLVDANGVPTTAAPNFRVLIERVAWVAIPGPGNSQAGSRFRATITWDAFRGTGTDSLNYYYEVYR